MIARWKTRKNKTTLLIVRPENDQEQQILQMLLENKINLRTHLLLLTKEKPSRKIVDQPPIEAANGDVWLTQEHL